ncbi:class Ib ribonucleoside-diphosphate reductase assembly flavoprotein NrdI [Corynebacterium auriscanis]|uniref:class Ib ribonucleoside-diphosphate reductase assembly flavoprotein NrdI n=1 Tax=Corynebacterium auriscanis TaxID=99807 RepID=UPI003CF78F48
MSAISHPIQTSSPSHGTGAYPGKTPDLVYFSSASGNTHRFIQKLDRPALRIPLRPKIEGMIQVTAPYVLVVPSYGGGDINGAVPRQVIQFLNIPENRSLIRGVITSGNTNFGEHFCIAGPVIAKKCGVPELYRFELLGTDRDVQRVNEGLTEFWKQQIEQATGIGPKANAAP